jgi:hypothetical protein
MKKLIPLAIVLVLLSAPAEAFSVKAPIKKAGHALKVGVKKVGKYGLYAVAAVAAIELCSHGGCN